MTTKQCPNEEPVLGSLMDYGARFYSPGLGRFLSADMIVPEPGDPQSLNRYAYVRNNPLVRIDPTGHDDCAAGDMQCWIDQWVWNNRWYEAHGHSWNTVLGGWTIPITPKFQDLGIVTEVLGEAGITWHSGDKNWQWDQLVIVASAVVLFANRIEAAVLVNGQMCGGVAGGISGLAQLRGLLGNTAIDFQRWTQSTIYSPSTTAQREGSIIKFFDAAFDATRTLVQIYGTVIHELAHIIGDVNFTPSGAPWKTEVPYALGGLGLVGKGTPNDAKGNPEYFAEAVKMWVLPTYPSPQVLSLDQSKWLTGMFKGWGPLP